MAASDGEGPCHHRFPRVCSLKDFHPSTPGARPGAISSIWSTPASAYHFMGFLPVGPFVRVSVASPKSMPKVPLSTPLSRFPLPTLKGRVPTQLPSVHLVILHTAVVSPGAAFFDLPPLKGFAVSGAIDLRI